VRHDLPFVDECWLLVAKVHLQPQPIGMLDNRTNHGIHNLIVQTDLDVIATLYGSFFFGMVSAIYTKWQEIAVWVIAYGSLQPTLPFVA
jgi:uncharacterized membrane protein YjjB (DUF3815 family)